MFARSSRGSVDRERPRLVTNWKRSWPRRLQGLFSGATELSTVPPASQPWRENLKASKAGTHHHPIVGTDSAEQWYRIRSQEMRNDGASPPTVVDAMPP